jgi:hypothetical protein
MVKSYKVYRVRPEEEVALVAPPRKHKPKRSKKGSSHDRRTEGRRAVRKRHKRQTRRKDDHAVVGVVSEAIAERG